MKMPPNVKVHFYAMGPQGVKKKSYERVKSSTLKWIQVFPKLVTETSQEIFKNGPAPEHPIEIIFLYAEEGDLKRSDSYDYLEDLADNFKRNKCKKESGWAEMGKYDIIPPVIVYSEDFDMLSLGDREIQKTEKRLLFWDSSIWFRFVHGHPDSPLLKARVRELLKEIISYYQLGLYQTVGAREYLEMQIRLLKENKLGNIRGNMEHRAGVIPFQYRSETRMEEHSNELMRKIEALSPQFPLQWKTFLMDDFADRPLRILEIPPEASPKTAREFAPPRITKLELLKCHLENLTHTTVEIFSDKSLTQGDQLKRKDILPKFFNRISHQGEVYDIIFLDYFLGEENKKGKEQKFYYGFELLEQIASNEELQARANPFGKFWIFPISSFPYAFKTHVGARGDENFTRYWNLSDGGNPVNCPHHFRMKLLKLMYEQVLSASLDWKYVNQVLCKILGRVPTEMGENSQPINPADYQEISQRAKEEYGFFTDLLGNMYRLDRDKNLSLGKSQLGLAESLSNSPLMEQNKWFIRHLEQLVRMLAFEQNVDKVAEKIARLKQLLHTFRTDPQAEEKTLFARILASLESHLSQKIDNQTKRK